jgi:hypothetical protein
LICIKQPPLRIEYAKFTQARSLILITLGVMPPDPHPKLSVSAPLSIPLLGGVTLLVASVGGLFHFKQPDDVAFWHETDMLMQLPHRPLLRHERT